MTDRKGPADRLKVACEHCQRMTAVPAESLSALRQEPSVEETQAALNDWFSEHTGFAARDTEGNEVSAYYGSWITIRTDRLAQAISALYRGGT